jgi:hypothetical protein
MTPSFAVVEIGQEYLDWATKLRQTRRPDAGPVMRKEVGRYAVRCPDGTIAADGFPNRGAAEKYANCLRIDDGSNGLWFWFADSFADRLAWEEGDDLTDDEWCRAWVDGNGTRGIKNPSARFTELQALTIVFKYPLTREARLEFKSETGFTRAEIIECIRAGYRKIYAEDGGELAPDLPCWMAAPGSKWGIWGHSIGDLMVHRVDVDTDMGVVELSMSS